MPAGIHRPWSAREARCVSLCMRISVLLLKSSDEPLQQPNPNLILAYGILDAVFEVRIIVHLHDDDASRGLLNVDAIEAFPNRPGRVQRDVDDLGRRLVDVEGAKAALVRGAVAPILDDLPVPARHAVLTDEQRF